MPRETKSKLSTRGSKHLLCMGAFSAFASPVSRKWVNVSNSQRLGARVSGRSAPHCHRQSRASLPLPHHATQHSASHRGVQTINIYLAARSWLPPAAAAAATDAAAAGLAFSQRACVPGALETGAAMSGALRALWQQHTLSLTVNIVACRRCLCGRQAASCKSQVTSHCTVSA